MDASLPFVSMKPNYFTTYIRFDSTNRNKYNSNFEAVMPIENKSHGLMSSKANKRVKLAIDWLIYMSKEKVLHKKGQKTNFKFKLNFITLTLSSEQIHSDNEIKKTLLNQFLTELRTKYSCKNYIWRAETQRNGRIHFHICSDVFVPWRELRTDWNRIQNKLGYIDRYSVRTKKSDPNSTDVHAISNIKNLSGYLAKYCSKNAKGYTVMATKVQSTPFRPSSFLTYKHPKLQPKATFYRQVHGKLWGLSQGISKFKSAACEISGRVKQEIEWLWKYKKNKIKLFERATIYCMSAKELIKCKCTALAGQFLDYIRDIDLPVPEPVPIQMPEFTKSKRIKYAQTSIIFS